MVILLDGYNVLKQVFPEHSSNLAKKRENLIAQLGLYKKRQAPAIKDIIVIFDGGEFRRATREIHAGVVVMFSGQQSSADELIINYVRKNKQRELLLVTRDRELIEQCDNVAQDFDVLDPHDFHDLLQRVLLGGGDRMGKLSGGVQKFTDNSDEWISTDREGLDLLMSQVDIDTYDVSRDEFEKAANFQKRSKTKSKEEKRHHRKVKKLA